MSHVRRPFIAVACALLAVGCRGKLMGTAELHGPGTADAHFQSTGAPVVLWADTEGKWTGGPHSHFAARYEIDVFSGSSKIGHVSCATKGGGVSICSTEVSVGRSHRGDCELKLDCQLPAIPAGPATLHVTGTVGAGTSDVKRMSLDVREE
jgi:hypothetical protein